MSVDSEVKTIREPELKLLLSTIPDLCLRFEEVPLTTLPSDQAEDDPSRPPKDLQIPEKLQGKLEQFFCVVEQPGKWQRYLVTQKGHLRSMSAYACARLCKDLGINKVTLNLNNPFHLPEDCQTAD